LVEFEQKSGGNIRYKKNHLDDTSDWESEQIHKKGQVDPLGGILNTMFMGWEKKNGTVLINVFRKGDVDGDGKKVPRFVFEEIELLTERISSKEAEQYPACNQTAQIKGGQGLAKMFNKSLYFQSTASVTPKTQEFFTPNIASFVYFGDIVEEKNGSPKVFAGKVRAYLTSAAFTPKSAQN
jgi:hypothetical protein